MKRKVLPTIIGTNPPTKHVVFGKARIGKGYSCVIINAKFEDGVKIGNAAEPIAMGGVSAWLHFCTAESALMFADNLRDCTLKAMGDEKKEMTNYERILKRVASKDALAERLQEICNDADDCQWCPANEDGYCVTGKFREWLDEQERVEFPEPDFIYKEP